MPKPTPVADSGNRPLHSVRHRRLKATIWCNQTDKGPMYNVIVTRAYRDKETQEWRDTHSIGYDDLMNVAALMHEAHSYISNRMGKERPRPPAKATRTTPKAPMRTAAQSSVPQEEMPF